MENNNENAAKSPLHLEEYEPSRRQFLKEKGRSNSPVVVYDCDQKTVQVRSKKDFGK